MTAAHEPNENDGPHEGPIKTPKQLILAVFYAFVVPIFGIILLVMYVTTETRPSAGSDARAPKSIAERIRPVGMVEIKDASDVASMKTGEQVFTAQCTACHATGALNAPKLGDTAAWGPRVAAGFNALLHSAIAGKGQMPPQGGGDFSEFEIGRAVVYMANQGGASPGGARHRRRTNSNDAAASARRRASRSPPLRLRRPRKRPAAAAPVIADAGATPALYTQACTVCHAQGVAGAPKIGDKAAWAPRLAQGVDGLVASVVKGKNAMPPRGGTTATDAEIKTVVTWMVGQAK
jgi:cytochrome c5